MLRCLMIGREICDSRQKQTAKRVIWADRSHLARTKACHKLSQLGNATSNWKEKRRADLFPSDPAARSKGARSVGLSSAHQSSVLMPQPLRNDLCCAAVREGSARSVSVRVPLPGPIAIIRPHFSVASLTILEMLRGRRFQLLAPHRLPPSAGPPPSPPHHRRSAD